MPLRLPLIALLCLLAASASGQEVGQQVLARWDVRDDRRYAAATVASVESRWVGLRYASGEVQRLQTAALVLRPLAEGDLVVDARGAARVDAAPSGGKVRLRLLADEQAVVRPLGEVFPLVRTDSGVGRRWSHPEVEVGQRVLAKWDRAGWYLGEVSARQGEAIRVAYDDGSLQWLPADLVVPIDLLPTQLFAINRVDGQAILATRLAQEPRSLRLRFYDGTERDVPSRLVGAHLDQPGLDEVDPCGSWPAEDARPHAQTLRGWLSDRLQFYVNEPGRARTSPEQVEVRLVAFAPSDREPPPAWKEACERLAEQVQAFLTRELGDWATFQVGVLPKPVRGDQTLAWYAEHLDDSAAWHDWAPSGQSVRAAFPDGARPGRHRVVVVLPDMPGLSADDSGVERGVGFVRLVGDYLAQLTPAALDQEPPAELAFSDWQPAYVATTIAHEVLHTLGLPHTDGDPWSVMNLGPWHPIGDPRQHVALLHKLVLRSPFRRALGLSQGYALYLLDPEAGYLRVIAATPRLDARFAVLYGEGPGLFRLRPLLAAFAPNSACRQGMRRDAGERVICRSYLAALVAFVLDRHGPEPLERLHAAADADLPRALPRALGTTLEQLELDWHAWLADRLPE